MKNISLSLRAALIATFCFFVFAPMASAQSDDEGVFADYYGGSGGTDFGNEDIKTGPVIKTLSVPVTDGYLKIAFEQLDKTAEISLISADGKKVHASRVEGDNEQKGSLEIPVRNLAAGMYFVRLKNAFYTVSKQVLIMNE
ncbi:MAG: T9SS type A sorting domain-containing protein [Bacteroidetes bacterium]|nr:T9SS type A sorting domain-containing protein [Bacteroidota bacterium]MCB0855505.1 T9SS type A sorting domain-containing protein [Bacteroidota bacterium]